MLRQHPEARVAGTGGCRDDLNAILQWQLAASHVTGVPSLEAEQSQDTHSRPHHVLQAIFGSSCARTAACKAVDSAVVVGYQAHASGWQPWHGATT